LRNNYYILLVFILHLVSCRMEDNLSGGDPKEVFSVKNLLDGQKNKLSQTHHTLIKSVLIDGIEEKSELKGDDVDWEDILNPFYDLDIGSPGMMESYTFREFDSELTHIREYSRKPGEKGKVISLRIEEYPEGDMRISASEVVDNLIYYARSSFNMYFENTNRYSLLLKDFEYGSSQKMITRDTVHFIIKGEIYYEGDESDSL